MKLVHWVSITFLAVGPARLAAQPGAPETFKLGTFALKDQRFIGIVLRDAEVVHLARANRDLEKSPLVVKLPMPQDMKELAGRYDIDMRQRIYDIVRHVVAGDRLTGASRAPYVHGLSEVRTLPPIIYPNKILNGAGNYYEHMREMGTDNPVKGPMAYVFLKPPTNAVIGNGEPIYMPKGREKMDWEAELGVVIGRPAKDIELSKAPEHIFGYTLMMDVSDRGGRDRTQFGTDWVLGKGHDTYAPLGPFILPREFVKDPHELGLKLTLNGELMQDSKGKYKSTPIFTAYELLAHSASILTLEPGDVIACGSPAGVGAGRKPQVFMKPGDVVVATLENVGSLTHTIRPPMSR